jgi:hypothetical protein
MRASFRIDAYKKRDEKEQVWAEEGVEQLWRADF